MMSGTKGGGPDWWIVLRMKLTADVYGSHNKRSVVIFLHGRILVRQIVDVSEGDVFFHVAIFMLFAFCTNAGVTGAQPTANGARTPSATRRDRLGIG